MPPPDAVFQIFAWRSLARGQVANMADSDSDTSVAIANELMRLLDVTRDCAPKEDSGSMLEHAVRDYLEQQLPTLDASRDWAVSRKSLISDFAQYRHLAKMDALIKADPTGTLSVEIGRDYLIRPDVTIGIGIADAVPVLHAAISCKWTIRSDRVQNIRHEGVILTRHRRGRQPHVVTVTVEPLPTRLAAIARGTGEVDNVYHVALPELRVATQEAGTAEQKAVLEELVAQDRLLDLGELPRILTL